MFATLERKSNFVVENAVHHVWGELKENKSVVTKLNAIRKRV